MCSAHAKIRFIVCICVMAVAGCGSSTVSGGNIAAPPASAPPVFGCGTDDTPETGVAGDIPRADKDSGRADAGYNCGLSFVSELPASGAVQGYDHCAYVRAGSNDVEVFDMRDPVNPTRLTSLSPAGSKGAGGTSETMRVLTTGKLPGNTAPPLALLISGASVYDIRDCGNPVHKGDIAWPGILPWPAGLSHDVRISHNGKKVYASIGVVVADISDLDHPETWKVVNQTCAIAAQYHPVHAVPGVFDLSLCNVSEDEAPQLSHGPDDNDTGTRIYVGNQGLPASVWVELDTLRILDATVDPPRIIATAPGPGHSIDWFRSADGREYILHANELAPIAAASCTPHPRPSNLGFAFEAFITEVTGDKLVRRSMLEVDINKPENCAAKLASGQSVSVAYHSVDNPYKASFAMISFGDSFANVGSGPTGAGLRVFDIRDPSAPKPVAYFNRGNLQHPGVSHYDPKTGLLYVPGLNAMQVLELQPQIVRGLGLEYPSDPAYPRYPNGRAARPG